MYIYREREDAVGGDDKKKTEGVGWGIYSAAAGRPFRGIYSAHLAWDTCADPPKRE